MFLVVFLLSLSQFCVVKLLPSFCLGQVSLSLYRALIDRHRLSASCAVCVLAPKVVCVDTMEERNRKRRGEAGHLACPGDLPAASTTSDCYSTEDGKDWNCWAVKAPQLQHFLFSCFRVRTVSSVQAKS